MKFLIIAIACLLVSFASSCCVPEGRGNIGKVCLKPVPGDVPALIWAAATDARMRMRYDEAVPKHGEFDSLLGAINEIWWTNKIRDYALDLNFIVQNNYPGQRYGVPRENWANAEFGWKNRIFVTEPIPSFQNRCLVVISELSPCQTLVFAMGTNLTPAVIFDNDIQRDTRPLAVDAWVASENASNSTLYISTVEEIVYLGPGNYLLVDYDMRFGISREVKLTAQNDHISLVEIRRVAVVSGQ